MYEGVCVSGKITLNMTSLFFRAAGTHSMDYKKQVLLLEWLCTLDFRIEEYNGLFFIPWKLAVFKFL